LSFNREYISIGATPAFTVTSSMPGDAAQLVEP